MKRKVEAWAIFDAEGFFEAGPSHSRAEVEKEYLRRWGAERKATRLVPTNPDRDAVVKAAVALKVENNRLSTEVERLTKLYDEDPIRCVHGQPHCERCSNAWSRDKRALSAQVATLTAERDGAIAEAAAAKRERDALRERVADLISARSSVEAAVLAEREACAAAADAVGEPLSRLALRSKPELALEDRRRFGNLADVCAEIAAAIRARGKP